MKAQESGALVVDLPRKIGPVEHSMVDQDEDLVPETGLRVTYNYSVTNVYVKDTDYVRSNLLPSAQETRIEVEDDELLQAAHQQLVGLNENLLRLRERLAEGFRRIEAIEKTSYA
jgi:hypothetical protein